MQQKKSSFFPRIFTAGIMLPIGAFATFTRLWNGIPVFLVILTICVVTSLEVSGLMEKRGYRYYLWVNTVLITLSCVTFYLFGLAIYDPAYMMVIQFGLLTLYFLIVMAIESGTGMFDRAMENIGISLFGYVSLAMFMPMIILIKMMDMSGWILAILLTVAWLTDAGGLVIGKIFGRRRLLNLSSPNKTVEGYVGAVIGGLLSGAALYAAQRVFALSTRLSVWEMLIVAVVIIVSSIAGDLGESTFKRWAKSKDSSDFLPGHGGFFDRFDSVMYAAPAYYVVMKLLGY